MTEVQIVVVLRNPKAIRALSRLQQCLESILEDQPWNEDARNGMKCLQYAVRHLKAEPVQDGEE